MTDPLPGEEGYDRYRHGCRHCGEPCVPDSESVTEEDPVGNMTKYCQFHGEQVIIRANRKDKEIGRE
jgi:hypothetical protein